MCVVAGPGRRPRHFHPHSAGDRCRLTESRSPKPGPGAAGRLAGVALDAAAGTSGLFKSAAELIDSIIGKQADLGLVLVNAGVAGGGHRVARLAAATATDGVATLAARR